MQRWPTSASRARPRVSLFSSSRSIRLRNYTPAAVSQVKTVSPSPPPPSPKPLQNTKPSTDPFKLVAPQITQLRESLLNLLGSSHPDLTEIARYHFLHPSKHIRPLLVLLWSQATNGLGYDWRLKSWAAENEGFGGRTDELDRPLTRPDVLNDYNPNMPEHTASFDSVFDLQLSFPTPIRPAPPPELLTPIEPRQVASSFSILPTQIRLAQIVEMIHVASLLHDDVIDESPLRRGVPSAPAMFGSKFSILGGDFLLGRASAALSRLGSMEVVELISSVIANLVEGEILQAKAVNGRDESDQVLPTLGKQNWNIYLQKTYLKSASFLAKSARAAVVLGGCREGEIWKEVAYAYGRNIGIAFQLADDIMDYDVAESSMGKPSGADLQLGLATGPVLFAWEEHPELGPLIQRKFKQPGDVELARDYVHRSSGIQRTRELAHAYADKAKEVLSHLPDSEAKTALYALANRAVNRTR